MRKLVELDGEYGGMLEVDMVKLKRTAQAFRAWLLALNPAEDTFGFLTKDLPLVEAILSNTIKLPYRDYKPHNWEWREGLLPRAYTIIAAPFYNTIRGSLYAPPEVIMRDGRYFTWVDFEDATVDDANAGMTEL